MIYCQTSVLFLYKGANLVDKRAHGLYTLAGSPACRQELNPLVAYTLTTVYTCQLDFGDMREKCFKC